MVAHICHDKTYFSMTKLTFSRQNLLFHDKTYFLMIKLSFPRQNLLSHDKTYFLRTKLTFPRQQFCRGRYGPTVVVHICHGKTYFLTAKLTFPAATSKVTSFQYISVCGFLENGGRGGRVCVSISY